MDPVLLLMQPSLSSGSTALNLLAAIHARVDDSPALADLIIGGHYTGEGDRDRPDGPYVVLTVIAEPDTRTTGITYVRDTMIQVSIFGRTDSEVWLIKEAWNNVFNFRNMITDPLIYDDGNCFRIDCRVGPRLKEDDESVPGEPIIHQVLEMNCKQNRDYLS